MHRIVSNNGESSHGQRSFVCDTPDDIKNLPNCDMGCTCLVISTSEVYMINSKREWVKI